MNESGLPVDAQAEAIRIQHLLEETLDRNAGGTEAQRAEALLSVLQAEIDALPAAGRAAVVTALDVLHPEEIAVVALPSGPSPRELELEDEVARLRAALAAQPRSAAVSGPPSEIARRMVEVLVGPAHVEEALGDEERIVGALRALVAFGEALGRAFLGAMADPDKTMAGRVQSLLADELIGRVPAGRFASQLEQFKRQIAQQGLHVQRACEKGVQNLLKKLAPDVLEAEVAKKQRGSFFQVGYYKELWELFAGRFEQIKAADDIYKEYFDPAYRAALAQAAGSGPERRGKR